MLWLDTSGETDCLRRWDGEKWVAGSFTADDMANIYANIEKNRSAIIQTDSSLQLMVEQAKTELNSAITGLETSLSTAISQTARDITFAFSEATNYTVTATGEILEYINLIQSYQRFSADGLELGVLGSPFIAKLGNTRLSFLQNGVEIAYISNNRLYITEARITRNLAMGPSETSYFEWVVVSTGLALKWRG
jgi:hypothetical protein